MRNGANRMPSQIHSFFLGGVFSFLFTVIQNDLEGFACADRRRGRREGLKDEETELRIVKMPSSPAYLLFLQTPSKTLWLGFARDGPEEAGKQLQRIACVAGRHDYIPTSFLISVIIIDTLEGPEMTYKAEDMGKQ